MTYHLDCDLLPRHFINATVYLSFMISNNLAYLIPSIINLFRQIRAAAAAILLFHV